jgi:hypothetical protein
MFWITALGYAGVSAGQALEGLVGGTKDAQAAGSKGADTARKVIKKGM